MPLKAFLIDYSSLLRKQKKSHLTKRRKRIRLKRCCSLFLYTSACNFLHVSRQGKVVVFNASVIWEAESCTLQPTTKGGFVSFMTSGIQVTFIVSQRNMLKRQTGHIAEIFRKERGGKIPQVAKMWRFAAALQYAGRLEWNSLWVCSLHLVSYFS